MTNDEKEEEKPKEEEEFRIEQDFRPQDPHQDDEGRDPLYRKLIPRQTATVGRSIKLRDQFTLAGSVYTTATPVTVTASVVSTTETSLASFKFFNHEFHVGMVIRITAIGTYTSDGTRTVQLKVGLGSAPVAEWNSMTSTAASTTNAPWNMVWYGVIVAIGTAGTLEAQLTGAINNVPKDDANSAAVAFNTTLDNTISLTATWSANNGGNAISVRQFIVEVLN